jgi:predicted nucleic acid-binding protein
MKFVVDTNIVFSAILNNQGKIGDLLMNSHGIFEFHTCDTLRIELHRHRTKILELSKMTESQLDTAVYQITNCIQFTSESLIPFEFWTKGADLVLETDMDDIAFVALSEYLGIKLWTGDKILMQGLAKKGYSSFITTDQLFDLRSLLES